MEIPDADTRVCRAGCGQSVILAITGKTKGEPVWTPLDPEPTEDDSGRYAISREQHDGRPRYLATKITRLAQRDGMRAAGVRLHTSHGVTCPNRDAYMRRNRGAKL